MTRHRVLDDDARDRAALHVMGALEPAEAAAYEAHLSACGVCRAEVESLQRVAADLALLTPRAHAPGRLRARSIERALGGPGDGSLESQASGPRAAAQQPWKGWGSESSAGGFAFALASDAVWEPNAIEGIETRKLFLDEQSNRVTMLVRMAPGASYPPHVHASYEECYVLDGDLLAGDVRLTAGDYKRAFDGSTDGVQSTETGCLLLIVSSLHDELLPDAG